VRSSAGLHGARGSSGTARSGFPPPPAPPSTDYSPAAPERASRRRRPGLLGAPRPLPPRRRSTLSPPFFFPLLPPFSGGGEIGGEIPMGGAVQGDEGWGSIYRAARLGFQANGWTAAILGIRAQGHAAPIRLGRWGDGHGGRRGSPAPTRCVTRRKKSRGVKGCGG
jgi:hypothetical protein